MTEVDIRATAFVGSLDSAAATVVISAPVNEKEHRHGPRQHRNEPVRHEATMTRQIPERLPRRGGEPERVRPPPAR